MHKEHTLLELSDEEALKKENISLEAYEKEINEYLNKINYDILFTYIIQYLIKIK